MPLTANEAQLIEALAPIVAQSLPEIVAAIKGIVAPQHQAAASASDAAIISAFHAAVAADVAKDAAWLKSHAVVTDQAGTVPSTGD